MFSWICPRCGRDNPPSANACLSCGASIDDGPEANPPVGSPAPAAPGPAAKPAQAPRERQPVSKPQPDHAGVTAGLPTWLLTLVAFFAIVGIGSGVYFGIQYFRNRKQATTTGLDSAANVARTKLTNPLQKYIDVVGIRLVQEKKKPEARFIVVNHGSNEIDDISATVTLWASTSRSEEDSVGTFQFKIPAIGPQEAKELSAPFNTKLKFYELPDWQNTTPEVQITSP